MLVMPTRSGKPRVLTLILDSKQTVLHCSLPHLQEGLISCPHHSWGRLHVAPQAWEQTLRPCVHHPQPAGSQCRRERSPAPAPGAAQLLLAPLPRAPRTQLSSNIEMQQVSTGVSWCLLIKHELLGNCTSQLC